MIVDYQQEVSGEHTIGQYYYDEADAGSLCAQDLYYDIYLLDHITFRCEWSEIMVPDKSILHLPPESATVDERFASSPYSRVRVAASVHVLCTGYSSVNVTSLCM